MSLNVFKTLKNALWEKIVAWLNTRHAEREIPPSDFDRLRYEIRVGDVILVEGRTHVSEIIKTITLSNWTHSALYIGPLHNIDDPVLREHIQSFYTGSPDEQLIIESQLGYGTIVESIRKYRDEHLRICRPTSMTRTDSQKVIAYAINRLGSYYNVRQILDLARFLFPYTLLPRRWRSSLFEHNAGTPTHTVCSTMIAEAFASVRYPILPVLHRNEDGQLTLYRRNTRLITPKDFDYSPYFDVIKYPILDFDELAVYQKMPWGKDGIELNDENDINTLPGKSSSKSVSKSADDISSKADSPEAEHTQHKSVQLKDAQQHESDSASKSADADARTGST